MKLIVNMLKCCDENAGKYASSLISFTPCCLYQGMSARNHPAFYHIDKRFSDARVKAGADPVTQVLRRRLLPFFNRETLCVNDPVVSLRD